MEKSLHIGYVLGLVRLNAGNELPSMLVTD
jgi:hypothetical protein